MRIIALGGTRFIGRAIVRELEQAGHELLVVHRGIHEPESDSNAVHLHTDRASLAEVADEIRDFGADGAIDISAMNGVAANQALAVLPRHLRLVAISSADVYRAFASVHDDLLTDAVPLSEEAPVRDRRFFVAPDNENLEVEDEYLRRGAIVLRLAAVFGEDDYQRRHNFVLRRILAGRTRMPIGPGNFVFSRCYVRDVGVAVRLAIESTITGEVYNVAETSTWPIRLLATKIAKAAGSDIEFVTVDDSQLPPDLEITGYIAQPLLLDSHKLVSDLGWTPADPVTALRRSVEWEISHPPDADFLDSLRERLGCDPVDFDTDDLALSQNPGPDS